MTSSRAPRPSKVTLGAPARDGETILEALDRRFPQVGRSIWASRLERGEVVDVEGRPAHGSEPASQGLRLRYFREVEREPVIPFEAEILHREDDLLVVDKPPFLPVHPTGPYVNACLIHRLASREGLGDLAPIHRLDLWTSGLVLLSPRRERRAAYAELFRRREVEKTYFAVAEVGELPSTTSWRVESRIEVGEPWFRRREVPGEPNAVTDVELVEHRGGLGLFRLRPITGRQHQLRLHMARLGYPILHDRYYPELQPKRPPDFTRPLQLLAWSLAWNDPVDGRPRRFESRLELTSWGGRISPR